ncbi:hypothetical protein FRC02_008169 [Tulasnella sp. 418]|nr:hypothetical protein FRC02_008169 [Tulasnella sp. 418]
MAGDHACPVCAARFTRPQHVTRHMRSHTGDRPYKCNQCGDQFARSDLLSRHVNKCHSGQGGPTTTGRSRKNAANSAASNPANVTLSSVPSVDGPCDQCLLTQQRCDARAPCGPCTSSKSKCTHSSAPKPRRASVSNPINRRPQQDLLFGNQSALPIQDQYLHQPPSSVGPPQPYDFSSNQYGLGAIERSSALPSSLPQMALGGLSLPMSGSQFIRNDAQPMYSSLDTNMGIPGPPSSLDLGLSGVSIPAQHSGPGIPAQNPTLNGSAVYNDGGQFHYRRASLGVPGQTNGLYGSNLPPLSSSIPQVTDFRPTSTQHTGDVPVAAYGQQLGYGARPPSGAGVYDGFGDRARFDDTSSNSDYGSSAPSPVMSYASSSRPTSSSGHQPSISSQSQPASEQFISSLSGAVPLPTPMQLQTFQAFSNTFGQNPGVADTGAKPAVAVGVEGSPYLPYQSFDNLSLEDQHRAFAAAAANAHARSGGPNSVHPPVLSAGGREAAINELKEFWSAFICEPTTGGNSALNGGHTLSKQMSMPSLKTPMPSDRNFGSLMEIGQPTPRALYPTHQSILGIGKDGKNTSSTVGGGVGNTPVPQSNDRSTSEVKEKDGLGNRASAENLRSYQEACLKRETPMLRLNPSHRPKSRTVNSTSPPQKNVQLQPMAHQQSTLTQPLPPVSALVNGDGLATSSVKPDPNAMMEDKQASKFAAPFPPGTKEARDWYQSSNAASGANPTSANNYSISRFATVSNPNRPTYKRLPSTTLGPENTKITKTNSMRFPGDSEADDGDNAEHGGRGGLVSYPQPGYLGAAAGLGGAHGAWMRQRSLSSPTSLRSFEWQSLDAAGAR